MKQVRGRNGEGGMPRLRALLWELLLECRLELVLKRLYVIRNYVGVKPWIPLPAPWPGGQPASCPRRPSRTSTVSAQQPGRNKIEGGAQIKGALLDLLPFLL